MELRDYLNVVRTRRGIIVLATIIVVLVAAAVSMLQPRIYEAESKVLISEKDTAAAIFGTLIPELSSQPERALQTQVQLIELRPVAEATIRELGLEETPEDLLDRLDVTTIGQTNVISIRAQAATAQEAADISNAVAEEYVAASMDRRRESLKRAADEVEQRLEQTRQEILVLGRKIQSAGKSDELQAELAIATGTYTTLAEKLEQLRINEQLESGSGAIVQAAVAERDPVSPQPVRNTAFGLLVGLMFGIGMAFLYDYLDNTIKSTEEAERLFGGPVLGTIPVDRMEKGIKRRLSIVEAPGSATAEAYRVLRNSLDFMNFEHSLKTLLVTSAAPAEGKSTVAANLAAALAQAGKKVALVSVDFRRPTTDQFFQVNNMIGLSDVLLGAHTLKAALQRPGEDQLLVVTAGKMPPNPSELLGSSKMDEVIKSLEEWADWVIIDAPPLLAVADPAAVARFADGVLMVSKAGASTRENARKGTEMLVKVGARVIGVVIWGLDETKGNHGYGYYAGGYYYYHSYYGAAPKTGRAAATAGVEEADWEMPRASLGRRIAATIGRILTGILAFLAVLAVITIAAYFLDQYFGWGLTTSIAEWLPW